ncbi:MULTISPECIES: hypothetical protein [unclassified Streptomyces]|uniref:SCO0607 family lipoprotein n=1 Tax=Streptomyces TaxID=1883 RepID=UPI0001C1C4C7|nr:MULTISPECIES: hypothetical protein [unclassified Streptomyces]AEN12359.1 lipoprotein [Streptomyces sp. SirexAA-E]MYR69750.1 hypothetical protein [Streptomyces sp. SID4939]MYS04365.1 hypothetical protein [Streptomyces sp. SID4940]MYT63101.1 hypothetical protein [Streptomyces sp. SID8357]MYT88623.1 hypothetical protein [Streptomyces sp. SID8360]
MSRTRRLHRPSRATAGLTAAAAVLALFTGACSIEEAVCGGGEYPVMTVNGGGSACVPDGEEPSKGWVRYPEGKVPQHVGDTWDVYWETHTLDENGRTVELPEGE